MSYKEALEAAGAEVELFEEFGSYQGDWYARVKINGERKWIHGYFGSCSGCDAFEHEFSSYGSESYYSDGNGCEKHRYQDNTTCEDCIALQAKYNVRLAKFGKTQLLENDSWTQEEVERELNTDRLEWDEDSVKALAWIRENHL